jgi:hypothetical protein
MKKIILAAIIALAATGAVFAHGHHGPAQNCYINDGHYHDGAYYNGYH